MSLVILDYTDIDNKMIYLVSLLIIIFWRATREYGRARTPVRHLSFEKETVRNMQIFAYWWSYLFWIIHVFWTAWGCVDRVSLYGPLRSEAEFRHHLPVVLRIHNLPFGTCIWRTVGGAAEILSWIGVDHINWPYLRMVGWD